MFRRTDKKNDPGPREGDKVFGLVDDFPPPSLYPQLTPLMRRFLQAVKEARDRLPVSLKKMQEENPRRWHNRVDFDPQQFVFKRLDTSVRYLPPFDKDNPYLNIEVLWPHVRHEEGRAYLPWYGDAGYTVNGNSIVLQVRHGIRRILLAGDLNEASMPDLIRLYAGRVGEVLASDVYKAAHHGSQHFTLDFLQAVRADAAVISSGDQRFDDYGHPRAVLLGTITRYARTARPAIFCTELAACFQRLSKEELKGFKEGKDLYERAIRGIVHLRSNGKELYLGRVFGRHAKGDQLNNCEWDWDIWP